MLTTVENSDNPGAPDHEPVGEPDCLTGQTDLSGVVATPEDLLGAWAGSEALVYCRDWAGVILACNQSFAHKFGRNSGDLCGRRIEPLAHLDDMHGFAQANEQLRRAPHRAVLESRWLTPQGWRWISWEETAVADTRGEWVAVRSVGHDITRQRVAEDQIFKLSRAVEQSPVAILITDAEGNPQYVNAKFTEATGHTLEQLLDDERDVLREGHASEQSYQEFWDTVRAGREWRGELSHERPDGRRIWESVQVSCLRNPRGEVTHLLCLREDVTSRRTLEEQLRQAQKMESLGTLAGGIAHDFNNIIAVINGYSELAALNPGDTALLQKCMREIKRASQRAGGLVHQILTFSRKAEVSFAPVDLNQLSRELGALLSETFPRNVSFHLSLEENLPPLLADQNQLHQVILNLCVNARDAMPMGGTITMATTRLEGAAVPPGIPNGRPCACLTVTDTGTGMTPEVRARIFEPFFTTKAINKGTGLGLAVVYGIVASHDGVIEVESELGVGSSFKVYLPFADHLVAAPSALRSADFPGGQENVLVVDDEEALRGLLHAALTRKGYHVTCASDGLEAIAAIATNKPPIDVALLDLNMPGATGLEVLKVAKATHPSLRVLIVTGHLTPEVRLQFEELGQTDFLRKPYTLDEMGRKLRDILRRRPSGPAQ